MSVRIGIAAAVVAVLPALVGGQPAWAQLRVAATVPDLAALAREVGGPAVKVESLSLPNQDPHFVDAKPSLALLLNRSDLLLQVGLELEVGWLPTLLVGARNPRIQPGSPGHLDCSQFVHRLDVPAGAGRPQPGGHPPRRQPALSVRPARRRGGGEGHRRPAERAGACPGRAVRPQPGRAGGTAAGRTGALAEAAAAPARRPHRHLPQDVQLPGRLAGPAAGRVPGAQARDPAQPAPRGRAAGAGPGAQGAPGVAGVALPRRHLEAAGGADPRPAGAHPLGHQLPRWRVLPAAPGRGDGEDRRGDEADAAQKQQSPEGRTCHDHPMDLRHGAARPAGRL